MEPRQIDALIIRHLADLDEATKCANKLDIEIWEELGKIAEKWKDDKEWEARYSIDFLWFAPQSWNLDKQPEKDSEGNWWAYFDFDAGANDDWDENNYDLDVYFTTRLCNISNGKFGLRWRSDYYSEGNLVRWRKFTGAAAEDVIRQTGFGYEKETGGFYLPVKIDLETLAKAIEENAMEDAMKPFRTALDTLVNAEKVFTKLLIAAKKEFQK
jgi:hypothetical protein